MSAPAPDPGTAKEFIDWLIYGVVGVVTLLFARLSTTRGEKEAKAKGPDLLVTGGGFIDMQPVRELADGVRTLVKCLDAASRELEAGHEQAAVMADELKAIRAIMRERADEDHITAEVERRLRDALNRKS